MIEVIFFFSKVIGELLFWKSVGRGIEDFWGNVDNFCMGS